MDTQAIAEVYKHLFLQITPPLVPWAGVNMPGTQLQMQTAPGRIEEPLGRL
ncbi:MAG: hypothetical protein QME62_09640 [Armatimonadota bacterium]|nr:hypothetical protein [Armatimonadota bacterium]